MKSPFAGANLKARPEMAKALLREVRKFWAGLLKIRVQRTYYVLSVINQPEGDHKTIFAKRTQSSLITKGFWQKTKPKRTQFEANSNPIRS
jgi:hypothetical protein